MNKTERKQTAQEALLAEMFKAIRIADREDVELGVEMTKQAQRTMKLFGISEFPGLGKIDL